MKLPCWFIGGHMGVIHVWFIWRYDSDPTEKIVAHECSRCGQIVGYRSPIKRPSPLREAMRKFMDAARASEGGTT